ncbi:uncharacterized protein LOC124807368 [Hydra vulgaris]|uniref:uncharacterized protein LOC124807368 n=1 Tax=Hydra vulgaris TaxID=6087 RepID=UPI001F5F2E54|nr:uncharacterized protein LOC124807368 [Hydra vulgaris]
MVRNYKRKTNRGNWDESNMKLAIQAVKNKEMTLSKAANEYSVPKDSLNRRVNKSIKTMSDDKPHIKFLGSYRKVLSDAQEKDLAQYIIKMELVFYGISINELQRVVYDYVVRNKINHPFNTEKKLADRDFIVRFLKRQPFLSIRKPEAVSINRVFGLNKAAVQRYFDNLEKLINENQFEANRICDESGFACVHKPLKVIAHKGNNQRVVSSVTSGERGQTTTVIQAFNCVGHYTIKPPMIIFKRKRMLDSLIDDALPGTVGRCSKNGWVNTNLFMDFIRHFVIHGNCSTTNKCLLVLDGHKSHTKNLDFLNYASINGLHILSLPPHRSHKLQPLDRTLFKSLKSVYNLVCTTWMRKHPGRRITVDKLSGLLCQAYVKAATVENAISGFRVTGINPFNREILPESDYFENLCLKDSNTNIIFNEIADINPEQSSTTNSLIGPNQNSNVQTSIASFSVNEINASLSISNSQQLSFTDILSIPAIEVKTTKRKGENFDKHIHPAKVDCYPNKESYYVTEICIAVSLQDLLGHTVTRLVITIGHYLEEVV